MSNLLIREKTCSERLSELVLPNYKAIQCEPMTTPSHIIMAIGKLIYNTS
jgi:hypothetical protein